MKIKFPIRPVEDLREDPLRGAYGLAWYERKPSSLTEDEWDKLNKALEDHVILSEDYAEWRAFVR